MEKIYSQLERDIEKYGWHVTKVFDLEGLEPNFAYSVGVYQTFKQPDIIIFGLDFEDLHLITNDIVELIKSGSVIVTDKPYNNVFQGYDAVFRSVHKTNYKEYLRLANVYYDEHNQHAVQCFWPDKKGRFPWEEGCDFTTINLQPLLYQG